MEALGVIIAILWAISAFFLVVNKLFVAEIIVVIVLALLALLLTCTRKDLVRYQCHCIFGGIIICLFLLMLSAKELSFGSVCSSIAYAGLLSLPLVILDRGSKTGILRFWSESGIPLAIGGSSPEDWGSGASSNNAGVSIFD